MSGADAGADRHPGDVSDTGSRSRASRASSRLFVAIRPDARVRQTLLRLRARPIEGLRWVDPSHWHVTLRFFASADPDEVVDALDRVRFDSATAVLGPEVVLLGRRAVVVPAAGLDRLAGQVVDATRPLAPSGSERFAGHVTLGRIRRGRRCSLIHEPVHGTFPVTELELVASELGRDGPRHTTIWRAPLGSTGSDEPSSESPDAGGRDEHPGREHGGG